MRELLTQNNIALSHGIEQLQRSLTHAHSNIPVELKIYAARITNDCEILHARVLRNLESLKLGQANLLRDILSETESVTRSFYALDSQLVSPILRGRNSDRLSLKLLQWLHATHPQTQKIPAAVCDGEFGIWPISPSLYFSSSTAQQGLRNLPIFFHEFGHLLYRHHQQAMDAFVNELQVEIRNLLYSPVGRDDTHAQAQAKSQMAIVETWYAWTQEFFCDAVGFFMAGPAFAYAFSMYFRTLGWKEYYVPKEELAGRSHPVTWMRIHLLAERARQIGYEDIANDLEEKWQQAAEALGIVEDYDGFYDAAFLPIIQQKLEKMLTEANPRQFQASEVSNPETASLFNSPVALLNAAWQKFWDKPEDYRAWEENAIAGFLETQT